MGRGGQSAGAGRPDIGLCDLSFLGNFKHNYESINIILMRSGIKRASQRTLFLLKQAKKYKDRHDS